MSNKLPYQKEFEDAFNELSIEDAGKKKLLGIFEKAIVAAFYDKISEKKPVSKSEVETKSKSKKETSDSDEICKATKADGNRCTFKAKDGTGLCGRHIKSGDKSSTGTSKSKNKHECNGFISKTGKQCASVGTKERPEGSGKYYCLQHVGNWKTFDNKTDTISDSNSDAEENESD